MNDPRYDKPAEPRPEAYRCPECGNYTDEEGDLLFATHDNLRHYEVVEKDCPECVKYKHSWDYILDQLKSIIRNLDKQTV